MKHLRLAAIGVVAAVALSGCAAGTPSPEGDPTSAPAPGEIDRDATLRVGVPIPPTNLDPDQQGTYSNAAFYLDPFYDRLINWSAEGELVPGLATSWEFIDEGTALRLELRDDVTFIDGSELTAEVVKANLERSISETSSRAVQTTLSSIDTVEVVDDYTVDIKVKPGTGADLPAMLADPGGYIISGEALDNPDLDQNPVGSGPYELAEYVPNISVTAERRDAEHWGGADQANFAEITISVVDNQDALVNSFTSGQFDLILADTSPRTDQLPNQGYQVINPAAGMLGMMFNQNIVPEFANADVRRAISYAIDREAISEVTLEGACVPTPQLLVPGQLGYQADLDDMFQYDPDLAREMLADAGLPSLSTNALYISMSPTGEVAEALQAMLADVGINVELVATTAPTQTTDWLEGNHGMRMSRQTMLADTGRLLLRSTDDPILLGLTSQAVIDASKGLIDATIPEAERRQIIEDTNRAMVEDAFNIIVCQRTNAAAAVEGLTGLDQMGSVARGGIDYRPLAFMK